MSLLPLRLLTRICLVVSQSASDYAHTAYYTHNCEVFQGITRKIRLGYPQDSYACNTLAIVSVRILCVPQRVQFEPIPSVAGRRPIPCSPKVTKSPHPLRRWGIEPARLDLSRRVLKTREIGRTPLLRNQWDRELNTVNISLQLNTLLSSFLLFHLVSSCAIIAQLRMCESGRGGELHGQPPTCSLALGALRRERDDERASRCRA
jgi:hypothetical protein